MSELPRLTPRQNEAAVQRAEESLALTSGAGCGKTLVLARRFTELLLKARAGENPFDRFVALTFTDKAALEMRQRVRGVLLGALGRARSEADRGRLAAWITELPAAGISTIHSFCASLLRRHAVAAGIDPAFSVFPDDLVSGQMQAEAAEEAILAAVQRQDRAVLDLLVRTNLPAVSNCVQALLERRGSWQVEEYADAPAILRRWDQRRREEWDSRRAALGSDLAGDLKFLQSRLSTDPGDALYLYARPRLGAITDLLAGSPPTAEAAALLADKPGNKGRAGAWGGREALLDYRRRLSRVLDDIRTAMECLEELNEADRFAAAALAALTQLAGEAERRYATAKRRAGVLDFEDLIHLTARLLRQDRQVRDSLRRRIGQLLIDECQDTDAQQLRMLWDLLAENDRPPAGGLFIVGDVKQSIYRFRGAQAEVFADLVGRFGSTGHIPLNESFRMHRSGAAFVNAVFEKLMAPGYEPIQPRREEAPAAASVEVLLADCPEADAEQAAEAQAQLLAERVAGMIGREELVFDPAAGRWRAVRPGDVAVLFARMTRSLQFEQALRQRDIPYCVIAGTGFFQQQEVFDVLNALAAVDNPHDDVALVGVLRSALFGLNDNALLHLARTHPRPYFAGLSGPSAGEGLPAAQRGQLRFAAGLLADLHRDKDALGPAGVIEQLLRRTGYGAVLLSEFHGRRKLANVLRLLQAARSARQGGMSLSDFVRRYGQFVLAESRHEQAPVVGENEDVVRLMTIHKAKGLEFPVVFVPDLNAGYGGDRRHRLLFRSDWGVTFQPPPTGDDSDRDEAGDQPLSFRLAAAAEERDARAEDVRKLYVAVTRHRDHLVLVGDNRRTKDRRFKQGGSYLDRLDDALGIAAALDAKKDSIEYAKGLVARLACASPPAPPAPRGPRPPGQRIADEAPDAPGLADALARAGKDASLPLVGPLLGPQGDGRDVDAGTVAATALADFQRCPRLFRWRYDLRVPVPRRDGGRPRGGEAGVGESRGLDAASAGSVFHRCLQLADPDRLAGGAEPRGALARALVLRAMEEMELDAPVEPLAAELAGMLDGLARSGLLERLRAARRRLTELPFVLRAGRLVVAGQVDLLYQDPDGTWRLVDYKSDRVESADAPAHARRYELQMLIYLDAARRYLGRSDVGAILYFLRPAEAVPVAASAEEFAALPARLEALAAELVRCRRMGDFPRRQEARCRTCPYGALCDRSPGRDRPPG